MADTARVLDPLLDALAELVAEKLAARLAAVPAAPAPTTAPQTPSAYLAVEDVARELAVTPATVRGWIHSGALRAAQVGAGGKRSRVWRVSRADLAAFVRPANNDALDLDAEAERITGKRGR